MKNQLYQNRNNPFSKMFQLSNLSIQQKKNLFYQAIKIRKTLFILNQSFDNFVLYQENKLINDNNWILCFGTGENYQIHYLVQQALKSMNYSQKLSYYLITIYHIKQWEQFQEKLKQDENYTYHDNSLQIKVNYKGWQCGKGIFNSQKLIFIYNDQKFQTIQIQLNHYFVRISKNKNKKSLVLMPINENCKNTIIRLSFLNQQSINNFLICYQNSYRKYVCANMKKGYTQSNHAEIHLKYNQNTGQNYLSFKSAFQKKEKPQNEKYVQAYLTKKYKFTPTQRFFNKKQNRIAFLWGNDWIILQNGQMIFNNQEILDKQRGVIKQIIKKIIMNVAKGKSVFSTSLPVTIFGNSSLTQKICKCLGYAPLVLQNCVTYLDRLKGVLVMIIGFSILFLQDMDKPFNSILGQTFQGQIDGCPVYSQQISHHPPITSFFMKGRGYYMYGSIQPRVQLGFNKAKGSNQGVINVSFNQSDFTKNVIKFNFPFTQLSGLIFGSRGIKRLDQSYIYDQQNKVFCKLNWGKNKKLESKMAKMENYVCGRIVKLQNKLQNLNRQFLKVNQQQNQQVLWQIQGNWTGKVFINSQLVFDFDSNMPFKCVESEQVLLSHCNLRNDIIEKRSGNIQQSQIQKDKLQNIQRNDKKLRQKYF